MSTDGRTIKYLTVSFFFSFLLACGTLFTEIESLVGIFYMLNCCLFLAFWVTFLVSLIYIYRKLTGPGLDRHIRRLILARHISTSIVYALSNAYMFIFVIYLETDLIKTGNTRDISSENSWWIRMLKTCFVI